MSTTKYILPHRDLLVEHFRVESFWDEDFISILENHFVGKEFSESSLAHELVIWFPKEWRAVLHELKKLLSSHTPMQTH